MRGELLREHGRLAVLGDLRQVRLADLRGPLVAQLLEAQTEGARERPLDAHARRLLQQDADHLIAPLRPDVRP